MCDVTRATEQRPQQLSDMTKTFYFAKREPPAPARADAPADDRAYDVAFWNSVQAANDCDAVRAYLVRFPQGAFLELARLSERRLCAPDRRITVIAQPTAPNAAAQDPPPPAPAMAPPAPAIAAAPVAAARPEPAITARPADPPPATNLAALPEAAPPPAPSPVRPSRTAIWCAISSSN